MDGVINIPEKNYGTFVCILSNTFVSMGLVNTILPSSSYFLMMVSLSRIWIGIRSRSMGHRKGGVKLWEFPPPPAPHISP